MNPDGGKNGRAVTLPPEIADPHSNASSAKSLGKRLWASRKGLWALFTLAGCLSMVAGLIVSIYRVISGHPRKLVYDSSELPLSKAWLWLDWAWLGDLPAVLMLSGLLIVVIGSWSHKILFRPRD